MAPSWSNLSPDVLGMILRRLPPADGLRFSAVCRSWNTATQNEPIPASPQIPWLMFPSKRRHSLYNLSEKKTYKMMEFPEITDDIIGTTRDGWVLYLDRCKCSELFGVNLVTKARLHPPSLSTIFTRRHVGFERAIVVPSSALRTGGCGGHTIVVIFNTSKYMAFAGDGDQSWTVLNTQGLTGFHDLLMHKGLIYAVNNYGHTLSCDLSNPSSPKTAVLPNRFLLLDSGVCVESEYNQTYLVEVSGELWQVWRDFMYTNNKGEGKKMGVNVLKLDMDKNIWVEMKGLPKDHAIFLGVNEPIVVSTDDYPDLDRDALYFADEFVENYTTGESYGMGVVCLREGEWIIKTYCESHVRPYGLTPFWVSPSPVQIKSCSFFEKVLSCMLM